MQVLSKRRIRLAGTAALLAAGFLLSPVKSSLVDPTGYASAWAGEHGGLGDQVRQNYGYETYSAEDGTPVTPCQSCYDGSYTNAQNLGSYTYGRPAPCESCDKGSLGK
ncbi:MAG TPA: hypothetical protein VFA23_12520 [Dongiaceae bacterium]|nr:hypothetical protein [Dongiaceae bacterium]